MNSSASVGTEHDSNADENNGNNSPTTQIFVSRSLLPFPCSEHRPPPQESQLGVLMMMKLMPRRGRG